MLAFYRPTPRAYFGFITIRGKHKHCTPRLPRTGQWPLFISNLWYCSTAHVNGTLTFRMPERSSLHSSLLSGEIASWPGLTIVGMSATDRNSPFSSAVSIIAADTQCTCQYLHISLNSSELKRWCASERHMQYVSSTRISMSRRSVSPMIKLYCKKASQEESMHAERRGRRPAEMVTSSKWDHSNFWSERASIGPWISRIIYTHVLENHRGIATTSRWGVECLTGATGRGEKRLFHSPFRGMSAAPARLMGHAHE